MAVSKIKRHRYKEIKSNKKADKQRDRDNYLTRSISEYRPDWNEREQVSAFTELFYFYNAYHSRSSPTMSMIWSEK